MLLLSAGFFPAQAALTIERATLDQYEDGPVLAKSHVFLPGEPVYFSCRFTGYQAAVNAKDESRSVDLAWQLEVTDPAGVVLVPPASGTIAEPISRQDKNWLPKFLHNFLIPAFAPPGEYHVKVKGSDQVAHSEIATELTFEVRGHPVEPSSTLTARNLHFLKQEQDGPPLEPASYRPGETLWARFDITGYAYETTPNKSKFSVEYGLAILRESGQQVFAQPAAASDSHESFYPQRYVPGAVSLTLDPNVPTGSYILLITIEDKVGGQKAETRGTFAIEK